MPVNDSGTGCSSSFFQILYFSFYVYTMTYDHIELQRFV